VTVLGLTFKSTSAALVAGRLRQLAEAGAQVSGYDRAVSVIEPAVLREANVTAVDDPYRAAKATDGSSCLPSGRSSSTPDWSAIAEQAPDATLIDARNLLDPKEIARAGLSSLGNRRPSGF
jgi:UDPglucose 6-dehydrogenase